MKTQKGILTQIEVLPSFKKILKAKDRYLMKRSQSLLPCIGFEVLVYNMSYHKTRSTSFIGHYWRWGRRNATQNLF